MRKGGKTSVSVLAGEAPGHDSMHHSVSVRKIDNGYVRSTSRSGPDGYESSETFHRKHPGLGAAMPQRDSAGSHGGTLRDAIAHCKGEDCK